MSWTELHGLLLARAFERVLGRAERGAMAYVRCLEPDIIDCLASDAAFSPSGWRVFRVADRDVVDARTITADRAVELRELKSDAVLLLVDTELAGAGMDGIYNASQEVGETSLFREAHRLCGARIKDRHSAAVRDYIYLAAKKAQGHGRLYAVSHWAQFDFFCQVAASEEPVGKHLYLLGLWPVRDLGESNIANILNTSRQFVDGLLGPASASAEPALRIKTLLVEGETREVITELEQFLRSVDTMPLLRALEELSKHPRLWIGPLHFGGNSIRGIELISWRNKNGTIAKWSGLIEEQDKRSPDVFKPPVLVLPNGTLEIRWKAVPANLPKGAAAYRVSVQTDKDEEVGCLDHILHTQRRTGERCRFSSDDFPSLAEDVVIPAKVIVEVAGSSDIEPQESEEFTIRFGETLPPNGSGSVAKTVRTFSEGLAESESREKASETLASSTMVDAKGFAVLRKPVEDGTRKSFKVHRPALLAEVETQWIERSGAIGRWIVRVRTSGSRAGAPEFVSMDNHSGAEWERTVVASRKMAKRFDAGCGGVGQVYDDSASFDTVQEYLRAWTTLLREGAPTLALAHTVEVRSLSNRNIGLIVLPAHPLRVAWQAAYDNLVFHTAFQQGQDAKRIRDEFEALDGAMFPAFLPNPHGGAFVFADTLGFHAVAMVPDVDKEPKAAVAVLAQAMDSNTSADSAPLGGSKSASVLTGEIVKYLECHKGGRRDRRAACDAPMLQIHALRAGDGLTVARALGGVHEYFRSDSNDSTDQDPEDGREEPPAFSLSLYPSSKQRSIAGRYIASAREKRRTGAGVLPAEDRWMLESMNLPGGVAIPRLRWARKEPMDGGTVAHPESAAHLAIAFDTFEAEVVGDGAAGEASGPYHAFGLLSFYDRHYSHHPDPVWRSTTVSRTEGEKYPGKQAHTERLVRMQDANERSVTRHLGGNDERPALVTKISPEKRDSLNRLHHLCDWVVTLDRNAGIEYFDSPRDNRDIYDAYVIDCVPEREDLGCLQLITSTTNIAEVRILLDDALDKMALSRSRKNAEFLLEHLKALSGRLAIRLTGHRPATSELIALAVSHASCRRAMPDDECWVSLEDGFIIPVDDVGDLIRPILSSNEDGSIQCRPDLIYVTAVPRKGLRFQFIEVKYRRDLRAARRPDLLNQIDRQTHTLRERWFELYGGKDLCTSFRAIRRARLARLLRFYADKAHRHYMSSERYDEIVSEITRMVKSGSSYPLLPIHTGDRGWVFCPEYSGIDPLQISPNDWSTKIFLFGPRLLPDSNIETSEDLLHTGRPALEESPNDLRLDLEGVQRIDSEGPLSVQLGKDVHTDADVRWQLTIRGNPHLLIAGLPGMGKTTCLLNLCRQMVSASVNPIIFSYHQDIDERLEELVAPIRFVDFDGLGFNPLTVSNSHSPRGYLDVAGSLRDIFSAIFPDLGELQCESIRQAIKDSFNDAGWSASEIGPREPEFRRFVEILRGDPKPNRGLQTLLARLSELDDYGFFDVGQIRETLWRSDQPTVVRIHKTQNEVLQRAFAALVFYGLYKDMFRRGVQDRITNVLIFDEAHRAAGLKLIPTMAKECRKYGISLVLASQEARDFNTSLFSAIANYLVLRLTDSDAKALVRNVSTAKQERTLIDQIKQMPQFKGLYFGEGGSRATSVALSSLDEV